MCQQSDPSTSKHYLLNLSLLQSLISLQMNYIKLTNPVVFINCCLSPKRSACYSIGNINSAK